MGEAQTIEAAAEPTSTRRRARYGVLLVVLLALLLVQGMAPAGAAERIAASVLAGGALVCALRAAEARPSNVRAAIAASGLVVAYTVVAAVTGDVDVLAASTGNALLLVFAPPAVALGVIRSLRRNQRIPVEAVLGVLCLYLLFGMIFAFVYGTLDRIDSPFFAAQGAATTASNLLYFSFTTLTTVGYGDFTARTPVGHTLAVLEALLGQIYLVTVVSLIVSNVGRERVPRR